jgi:hypothetical protein
MSNNGPGAPISINQNNVFRGQDKTNGFLMRNSDGRVAALTEGFSKLNIAAASALFADGVVPWGSGLWRDIATIDASPGAVHANKPTKGWFVGALKLEQGQQTGNPVQPWGIPTFSRGTLVRKGPMGYKVTMTAVGQEANFLAYLKGDATKDTVTVRKLYADWIAALKAGADGDRLALFFANDSGFPIISLVVAAELGYPTLANATFAGWVEHLEPENQAVYVDLRADQIGVAPAP